MKILIAEDDKISRSFLQKLLIPYGECDVVVDGMEALDAFILSLQEEDFYDLLLLDIMMPKVDGIKVLKAIRDLEKQKGIEKEKQIKVIITSALVGTDFVENALKIGCEGIMAKPINTEKLLQLIKKLGMF